MLKGEFFMENQTMQTPNMPKKNNTPALISFILSLVGILVAGIPCGIAAIITGIIGIVKFNPETEKGKGLAIAGLIIGIVDVIMVVRAMGVLFSAL